MKSAFEVVKETVSLLEVVELYSGQDTSAMGNSTTYELEDKSCPFCDHKDCFKIDMSEEPPYYNCFSCEAAGDSIKFVQEKLGLKRPIDAVQRIAKDFGVELPKLTLSPVQQVMNAAAEYYGNLLLEDSNKYKSLGDMTPLEYQIKVRKHDPSVLEYLGVGWSDGKVVQYLDSMGFDKDVIKEAGLLGTRGKGDYLPGESFIYPKFVRGGASHFTFKNLNGLTFQQPKKYMLNGALFYNQDSVRGADEVVLVEGENDLISVIEGGWGGGVIACIGQLSGEQVDWLEVELQGKSIITCFDNDTAGVKYRERVAALSVKHDIDVDHIVVPGDDEEKGIKGYSDIDEYIRDCHTFNDALQNYKVNVQGGVVIKDGVIKCDDLNVFEKDGAYYKVVVRNGEPEHDQISNFVIKLKHILIIHDKRFRVVKFIRQDGLTSEEVIVDSKTKINLRLFNERVSEYVDCRFRGSENDLDQVWRHVLKNDGEFLVDMAKGVGRIKEAPWTGCWIFQNLFIDREGNICKPDDDGVFWPYGKDPNQGKKRKKGKKSRIRGICAQSVTAESITDISLEDIPALKEQPSEEKYHEAVQMFLDNLTANFGSRAQAITAASWCMSNAFSDQIFDYYKFFPFPFIWGKFGGGKSGVLKILLSIYNMQDYGMTTVGSLKTGVGFERKMAYYCSLPMALDEVRNDPDTRANYQNFRKWFNRQGRALGSKDADEKVRERPMNSTLIFGGEEIIGESATRSRMVPIRLARMEDPSRETEETYATFVKAIADGTMSSIGLYWITLACETDFDVLFEEVRNIKHQLKELCPTVKTRTLDIYAILGFFGKYLAATYYPDYDYITDLSTIVEDDKDDQETGDIISKFLSVVEGLIASNDRSVTSHHIFVKDSNQLCIWFDGIMQHATRPLRDMAEGNTISDSAIRKAFREEKYYIKEDRVTNNVRGKGYRRRCLVLDLETAPESILNIALAAENLE